MCVGEMVCHLRESYRLALGERSARPLRTPLPPGAMKWLALRFPRRWPKNVPTVPELMKQRADFVPEDFATDQASLVAVLECFGAELDNRRSHPFFGPMRPWDWMRWGYLHADHHLRQFGR